MRLRILRLPSSWSCEPSRLAHRPHNNIVGEIASGHPTTPSVETTLRLLYTVDRMRPRNDSATAFAQQARRSHASCSRREQTSRTGGQTSAAAKVNNAAALMHLLRDSNRGLPGSPVPLREHPPSHPWPGCLCEQRPQLDSHINFRPSVMAQKQIMADCRFIVLTLGSWNYDARRLSLPSRHFPRDEVVAKQSFLARASPGNGPTVCDCPAADSCNWANPRAFHHESVTAAWECGTH